MLVRNVFMICLLFMKGLCCSGRRLVQIFPAFTRLQHRQLHLSLHRQQSDAGLFPSHVLVAVESVKTYGVAIVALFEFITFQGSGSKVADICKRVCKESSKKSSNYERKAARNWRERMKER